MAVDVGYRPPHAARRQPLGQMNMLTTNPNDLQNQANRDFRDLASEEFDTRTLLRNAADQAIARKYEDFLIVDTDSHHYETEAFKEIAEYIEDPVMRYEA